MISSEPFPITRRSVLMSNRFAIESLRALLSGSGYLFNCSFGAMLKTDRAVLLRGGMGSHLRVILFHSRYLRHDKALVKERFSESI